MIGINSQIETGNITQGSVGVGFAVPIDTVREVASQLMETGRSSVHLGGVDADDHDELAESFRLPTDDGCSSLASSQAARRERQVFEATTTR